MSCSMVGGQLALDPSVSAVKILFLSRGIHKFARVCVRAGSSGMFLRSYVQIFGYFPRKYNHKLATSNSHGIRVSVCISWWTQSISAEHEVRV